jgi:hypothetical protein
MPRTCFVMTPVADKFAVLLNDVIVPTVRRAGLEPVVAALSYEPGSIPAQIDRDITAASVAIAVLTDGNVNVGYEMGLAHKAGVPVIPLIESAPEKLPVSVPFDVRHHRVLPYQTTPEGYEELRRSLLKSLPVLDDERLLAEFLAPVSIECRDSVIAAAPLSYRDARRNIGGVTQFCETYSDHVGIRGLLRALTIIRGFDGLPELWNPGDFRDVVLKGDDRTPAHEMTVYSIGSPKSNRFTGILMERFFESHRPRFAFVADESSPDLRDVQIVLKRDGSLYMDGLDPGDDHRRSADIGLVVRGPNPFAPGGMMMILAGRSALGTEAACRAVVEPDGLKSILALLEADAVARKLPPVALADHSRSFWATVTMRVDPRTRRRPASSVMVQMAKFCDQPKPSAA